MRLSEFEYQLPVEAIAQEPVEPRDAARLLIDRGPDRAPENSRVDGLAAEVGPGDVVVVNTTRVRPARLAVRRATGGAGEVLLLSPLDGSTIRWEALVRPSAKLKPGDVLRPQADERGLGGFHVRLEAYDGEGRWVVELGIDGAADGRTLDGRNLDDAARALTREHGKPRKVDGILYVPLYHPAAALHRQDLRPQLEADMLKLKAILEQALGQA